jgi:hypothetical protein
MNAKWEVIDRSNLASAAILKIPNYSCNSFKRGRIWMIFGILGIKTRTKFENLRKLKSQITIKMPAVIASWKVSKAPTLKLSIKQSSGIGLRSHV